MLPSSQMASKSTLCSIKISNILGLLAKTAIWKIL